MVAYGMELGGIALLGSSYYNSRDQSIMEIDVIPFVQGVILYVMGRLSNRQLDEERASAVSGLEKDVK